MSQRVLSFHYVLTNKNGEVLDSSREAEPFPVMEGHQQILQDLETELFKMKVGDRRAVHLTAERAYGVMNEKLKVKVNRSKLPKGNLEIGSQFQGGNGAAQLLFTVIKIEGEEVYLDGNHPLAGQDLTFEVEVMAMREATAEELQHGHAHAGDGHHHH